jgi:hypothetical protein
MKLGSSCLFLALLTLGTLFPHAQVHAQRGDVRIANINARINAVKTYADLGAEWWQWALQAPAADSPLLDTTGEKCSVGQQGPVWFLAGTLASGQATARFCEVPDGKALFFPLINNVWLGFLSDPPEQRSAGFVRQAAENACDSASVRDLSVKIDGRTLSRPERFLTTGEQSPVFQIQLPTDNILGATADDVPRLLLSPSAHKGYYLYLHPLHLGAHTIEWTATWDCTFGGVQSAFSEIVKYNLKVLPGVPGQVD